MSSVRSKPDSKRCVVPPSSCPFTRPTCLLSCEQPPPIYPLIFPLSPPPPPPLPTLSLFVCLILLLPLLLCLPPPDCAVLRWSKGNSTIRPTPWWTLQRWVQMTKLKGPMRCSFSGLYCSSCTPIDYSCAISYQNRKVIKRGFSLFCLVFAQTF